jgi:hypothetical protein
MWSFALAERFVGRWRRARSEGSLGGNVWDSFERRERLGMDMGYCSIVELGKAIKTWKGFL